VFLLVTAAVLAANLARNATAQSSVVPLFTDPPGDAPALGAATRDGLTRRSRAVVASLPLLQAATAAGQAGDPGALLTLNLFDDVSLPATFERFETDAFGHQTWVGRVVGDRTSTVTLTWKGDVLSGGVQTGDELYRLSTRAGVTIVDQIDPGGFRVELPPLAAPEDAGVRATDEPGRIAAGEIVDIFVYYTAAARAARGGQAQIEALVAQGIADSNTTYTRSGVQAMLRLVGTGELAGFVENATDMQADLIAFRNSAAAQNTRDVFNADVMHLVLGGQSNACGVAYLGPSVNAAYGVTSHDCFFQYSFTHEVGHNFGNNHAPEDGINSNPFRPYSYGYKNCTAVPRFRTVMAYACASGGSGSRILNLSNPNVANNGLPTGTSTQNNALSQAEAFSIVQQHRTGTTPSVPSVPLNLQATVAGNQLTVSWAAPSMGAPISTYLLGAGSGPGLTNVFSGAVGSITVISAVVPNGTYYLRVAAQNVAGVGPATADVVATVGPVAPGAPRNLNAVVAGSLVTVSWLPPDTGGAVVTYVVQAGSGSGLADIFNGALGPVTTISANAAAGTYYLRVLAQGPGGMSPPSTEVVASVACPIPAAPVLSGSKTGNIINLSWTTPGDGVAGYTLRAGTAAGLSDLFIGGVGLTNALSAPVPNGVYFIRVSASSACGESAASNEVTITIP
jgi:hypothetical protein